jgi:hypothetical protein
VSDTDVQDMDADADFSVAEQSAQPAEQQQKSIRDILEVGTRPDEPAEQEPARSAEELEKEIQGLMKRVGSEGHRRKGLQRQLRELREENEALLAAAQEAPVDPNETQAWLDPYGSLGAQQQELQIQNNGRVSRAEFIAEHGKATFEQLDSLVQQAAQSGMFNLAPLSQAMRKSADPVGVMADFARQYLGWSPDGGSMQPQQAQPARAPVFPSNIAGARNVGQRRGPEWSGPPSLSDIFDRARK